MSATAIEALEAQLGHRFADPSLLEQALTHKSRAAGGYERLEFLGDRVLGLIVAEMLMTAFPHEAEGLLTRRFHGLVRLETLAAVALDLGLGDLIRLPAIEERQARANPSLLADVCEAVVGALHLDGGIDAARGFVQKYWRPRMLEAGEPPKDPKTALQEWAQRRALPLPDYRLVRTEGPPHQPLFTVAVMVSGQAECEASGPSKRLAEAAAAAIMLERLQPLSLAP
jgi:ribonuclease-3